MCLSCCHFTTLAAHCVIIPVYNIIGLICADDAEGVDGSVGGCKVGVLPRSPGKTPCWALTACQKLTHTGEQRYRGYNIIIYLIYKLTTTKSSQMVLHECTTNTSILFLHAGLLKLHGSNKTLINCIDSLNKCTSPPPKGLPHNCPKLTVIAKNHINVCKG